MSAQARGARDQPRESRRFGVRPKKPEPPKPEADYWEALDDSVAEAVHWGFDLEWISQLPISSLKPLLDSIERVKSRNLVEQTWLDLVTSQGSGKDVKKAISHRAERGKPNKEKGEGAGLSSLLKQRNKLRAPRRK